MILPDVNVLIYAFYENADEHPAYARWLNQARRDGEDLLYPDSVLLGFLRIVTSPRIYARPAPLGQALAFTTALRRGRRSRKVEDHDRCGRLSTAWSLGMARSGARWSRMPTSPQWPSAIRHDWQPATAGSPDFPG